MRKVILSVIFLCCFAAVYSQSVIYPKAFNDVLAQATSLNKLVFLTIEPPVNALRTDEANGLKSPDAAAFYNQHFVTFSVNYDDTIAQPLIKWYHTTSYPAYVIADEQGNLLNKGYKPDTTPAFFIQLGQKAIDAQSSGRTIGNYSLGYKMGTRDSTFLKTYITLREELGFYNNAGLADDYTALLHPEDASNYNEVLFILNAGPYAYGKAYEFCHSNQQVIDSIYHYEPLALRAEINRRIANNTMDFAIRNKRLDIAQSTARFVAKTWTSNTIRASKANSARMLDYYWGVRDSASYLSLATFFYDAYYMTISADSAKTIILNSVSDSTLKNRSLTDKNDTPVNNNGLKQTAGRLNTAAYRFYALGTRNQNHLKKALIWVVHSIELYPDCHNFDTLAHLLYRLGYFDDAEANELHAIEFAKQANMSGIIIDRYHAELSRIKNKQIK